MIALWFAALFCCTLASALYSGGETAVYSLSRVRIEAESQKGHRSARIVRDLLGDEIGLLITILVGNNLAIELASRVGEALAHAAGVAAGYRELLTTVVLTPFLFLFAELIPKDLFRRRPHALTGVYGPFLALSKVLYLPLALPLRGLIRALERMFEVSEVELEAVRGRRALLSFLAEGTAVGVIGPDAERMVLNVLALRDTKVKSVMVPWSEVQRLNAGSPSEAAFDRVATSRFSRLPVCEANGTVRGYVHQLDVLGAGRAAPVSDQLRPLLELDSGLSIDRALAKLRSTGQRAALIGTRQAPLGLLTLKDLVEEISGDLERW